MCFISISLAGNRLYHRVVITWLVRRPDAASYAVEFRAVRHVVSAFPGDDFARMHPLVTWGESYERMGFSVGVTGLGHQKGMSSSASNDGA